MAVLPTLNNLRGVLQKVIFVPIVYGFVSLLPVFLAGWENSDRLADRLFSNIRSKENMFDFVVVGGGTAGNLVANRLAEHYRVLLLEAGGTPSPFQTVPALALKFLNHPQTDWSYKTVPQRRACLNSVNQQASWSSGRGLGGTSNINFMSHTRGHPMDFDKWSDDTGDPSWSYSSVLPYFKRFETFSGTSNDPEARGHDGELRIRKPSYIGLSEDWVRAGQELGYPFVDLNGRHEEGFGILQYPIFKGLRQTTYSAFLLPMHKSPRLTIRRYAQVRKVLFRDMNNLAYGVEYVRHGRVETAVATKEVILSAGTLGSSKLLMLSGVGPRSHLEELGIPVRSDLPVGHNLQDHLAVHLGPFFIKEPKSFLFDRDVTPENIVRWLFLGTGPITTTGFQGAASIASSTAKSRGQGNWPDLHLMLHGQAIHQGYVDAFSYAYGLQEDELIQYYSNAIGRDSFSMYVVNARPSSHGTVLLSGASINDPLVIDPRYLGDPGGSDFKVLLEGVKTAMTISNTSMFQRLGTEFTNAKLPGCHEVPFLSDAYWECYIRRFTVSMHNPVGTCALGQVVDSYLRVRNTRGIRVVDASIQPTVVTTGTSASTLMIAEKAVDMILKDHGIPDRETDLFDVIFGKNGFFKRNPILRILQREFDTINPLRAIFKPFTSFTSRGTESDAKERFTRNGRIDNPFLQVISTFFGSAKQGDNSASGSAYVDVFENGSSAQSSEKLLHVKKRSEDKDNSKQNDDDTNNVISKFHWVLEKNSENGTSSNNKTQKSTYIPVVKAVSHNGPKLVLKTLNITELAKSPTPKSGKSKGGKRYALLQAILKEAELNATTMSKKYAGISSETTTPRTTQITPTPIISATLASTPKPIVEIVKFEKHNPVENEIAVDGNGKSNKATNRTNNFDAKPVVVNPHSVAGVLPINNIFGIPQQPAQNSLQNPLAALFKSLKSIEELINNFTAKDRRPLLPPPSSSSSSASVENFSASPTLNWFHGSNSIFGNLFNFNNNNNKNNQQNTSANLDIGKLGAKSNPFQFMLGNSTKAPVTSTPASKAVHVTEPIITKITKASSSSSSSSLPSSSSSSSEENKLLPIISTRTTKEQTTTTKKNDIFSSWFKPLPTHKPSSNWFRPFDKSTESPPSNSNWFKPLDTNAKQESWFKPIDTKSWLTQNNDKDKSTTSWFQPFTPAPKAASQIQPKNLIDPLSNLFELFFGGLKKHERREVFQTLSTMVEASKGLADLLGTSSTSGIGVDNPMTNSLNFFEQISKGQMAKNSHHPSRASDNNSGTSKGDEHYDTLLRDLISLNKIMSEQKQKMMTKKTSSSSSVRKVKPISEEIDEEFVLESLGTQTEVETTTEDPSVTTEIDTTTVTMTTQEPEVVKSSNET